MDPNQINHYSGAIAGMMGAILLVGLAFMAFFVFLFWRIFVKAGLSGPLSLLILIWPIGLIVVLCVLAFADWKVAPVATAPYFPPNYPPPPTYPPSSFPPSTPPTQL